MWRHVTSRERSVAIWEFEEVEANSAASYLEATI